MPIELVGEHRTAIDKAIRAVGENPLDGLSVPDLNKYVDANTAELPPETTALIKALAQQVAILDRRVAMLEGR